MMSHVGGVARAAACPTGTKFTEHLEAVGAVDEIVSLAAQGRSRALARLSALRTVTSWVLRNRHRVRAIHANGLAELNLVAVAAAVIRRPLVVWMHESSVSRRSRRVSPLLARALPHIRFAAVSEPARDLLASTGVAPRDSIELVPNPIDPDDVVAPVKAVGPKITIAFLGAPSQLKGFHLLPEIIRATASDDIEWLVFAGPRTACPETWAQLEELTGVTTPGEVLDVREAYSRCDIVVCPSLAESFGRVAAEAMANGIAVVASDLPALRDVVGAGGLLVPPGDIPAMAYAIKCLAGDPDLRARLGNRGRLRVASFSPTVVVERLTELYELVI